MKDSSTSLNEFIGSQIAAARKSQGITQVELSAKLDFKDRQILSNIEKGIRKVHPNELEIIMGELNKPFEYFSDPYQLPDKPLFSWRAPEAAAKESEPVAKGLVSAYRRFSDITGTDLTPIIPRLALTSKSSYEDARGITEHLAKFLQLENVPGHARARVACEKLNIEIFYLDIPDAASGASLLLEDFCALFINRSHPETRRNFSLAHELFHILTWDVFPPERFFPEDESKRKVRSEYMADNFAAALIIPLDDIKVRWDRYDGKNLQLWLEETASDLLVSASALFWRLVNIGELKASDRPESLHAPHSDNQPKPAPYSKKFVEMMLTIFENGDVSVRKVAKLLGCTPDYLEGVFSSYKLEAPFEL